MIESRGIATENIKLGDKRLNKRMAKLIERLIENPEGSIPEACQTKAEIKGAYRFFSSDQFTAAEMSEGFIQDTFARLEAEKTVLMIQDTTNIDYSTHRETKGLGYLEKDYNQGIKYHSGIAVNLEGLPLGITYQKQWSRNNQDFGKKHNRKKKSFEEKESYRWKVCIEAMESNRQKGQTFIHIADRECDIYEIFAGERNPESHLLIRAAQNRRLEEEGLLFENVSKQPIAGMREVLIKRGREKKERTVELEIRYSEVNIKSPKEKAASVPVTIIEAKEKETGTGDDTKIKWYLLTTIKITTCQEAFQCVKWYSMRWLIERYHYIFKEGCKIEELQLEEFSRLSKAIALYSIVAWYIMYLTYLKRTTPEGNAANVIPRENLEALYHFVNKKPGTLPEIPRVGEVVIMIAKLGGFLGRKGDGSPGAKVLWRGLIKLNHITEAYKIFVDVGNE